MKSLILSVFFSLFSLCLFAQTNTIKGILVDTAGQVLGSATVSILQKRDSSLISYTLSDSKGSFEVKDLPFGEYLIFISFTGYEVYKGSFSLSANRRLSDLGLIMLWPEYKTLSGVTVTESPVRMNGDTISFKANAFNSKPDATVEDVLKKIPGVQVQKDGTVKASGEQVQKIYVDGKEFFGNDPKIATKNLTADMVDQIQVFDDMSEQARFTKIDDGSKTKSINIKLKKDKRKGDFGRATAGIGTDSRYEGNFSFNHFRGDQRISLVGSANNTNKFSYSFSDISSSQNSGSQFSGAGSNAGMISMPSGSQSGISKPLSLGLNFNETWGPKFNFRGSYFYSRTNNLLEQSNFRRNTFPGDSSSEVNSNGYSMNSNRSHRINIRGEYTIDSLNSVLYTANFSKQDFEGDAIDTSVTYSTALYKYLAVKSSTQRKDSRDGINYSGELLYRRKFSRTGRTFTLGWRHSNGDSEINNNNRSPVTMYDRNGVMTSSVNLNQQAFQENDNGGNTVSASYTEPIGENKIIEVNYAYSGNSNASNRKTYDYNSVSGKYDIINEQQTNYFDYENNSSRIGFNYRQQVKKLNYQLGFGIQTTNLTNRSITVSNGKDTTISQRFTNLFPIGNLSYSFNKTKNLRIAYRGRTNAPSVTQLQNVPDVSNPLMIRIGNPSLKQEFVNNININYNSFALTSDRFLSLSFNGTYTGNKIVNSIDSVNAVTTIYKPENMSGSFTTSAMASVNLPVKKLPGLNLNLTNQVYVSRDANLVFKKKNFTTLFQLNQSAGINYGKEKYDVSLSTSFTYNNVSYNFNSNNNTHYINHSHSLDITYRFKNRFFLLTDFDYYINTGRTAGYNQGVLLWNMSLAKKILQKNPLEIKLTVYDILKQNKGINRIIGENYFEDVKANIVPRFFMLTASYNLTHLNNTLQKKN